MWAWQKPGADEGERKNVPKLKHDNQNKSRSYDDIDPKLMPSMMSVQVVVDVLVLREAACLKQTQVSSVLVHKERRCSTMRITKRGERYLPRMRDIEYPAQVSK